MDLYGYDLVNLIQYYRLNEIDFAYSKHMSYTSGSSWECIFCMGLKIQRMHLKANCCRQHFGVILS